MNVIYVWVMVAFGGFTNQYSAAYVLGGQDGPRFAAEADCLKNLPRVRQYLDSSNLTKNASVECVRTPLVVPVFPINSGNSK